jgi:aspartate/methionine/tyrosine aminotransferase
MEWAKTQSATKFTLATSGVLDMSWEELGAPAASCELRRPGGYSYAPLVQSIASRFGIPEESVVTAMGTSFANHLVMAALLAPGDEVLIEHPAYEPILAVAQYLGATVKRFHRRPETGFQIDMDELRSLAGPRTRLIVVTDLHNPTSAALDHGSLSGLQELAVKSGARILVDEVYLELRKVAGQTLDTSFRLGPEFIVTSSLTKAYGLSGLRCGWILAEPGTARRLWRLSDLYYSTPPHLVERLSVSAFQQLDRIAQRSRSLLAANRSLLDRFLDLHAHDLDVLRTDIGTVVFPRPLRISTDRLCDILRTKYETSVVPGHFFEMPDRFRVGIGGQLEIVSEGLDRLSSALRRLG